MKSTHYSAFRANLVLLLVPCLTQAATVLLELVPFGGQTGDEITVTPGATVEYQVFATVTSESDDPEAPDNAGLAFFSLSVETDLGVTQPSVSFPLNIAIAFPLVQGSGTPSGDDLLDIGGGQQLDASQARFNIAAGVRTSLVFALAQTPTTEGTFTLRLGEDASANVYDVEGQAAVSEVTVEVNTGFTIRTVAAQVPPDDVDDGNTPDTPTDDEGSDGDDSEPDGGDDTGGEGNNNQQPEITPLIAGAGLAVLLGSWWFGGSTAVVVVLFALVALLRVLG